MFIVVFSFLGDIRPPPEQSDRQSANSATRMIERCTLGVSGSVGYRACITIMVLQSENPAREESSELRQLVWTHPPVLGLFLLKPRIDGREVEILKRLERGFLIAGGDNHDRARNLSRKDRPKILLRNHATTSESTKRRNSSAASVWNST